MTAVFLTTAVLANSAWIIRCPFSATAQEESNVPDCCRNGMCPHHAAEHKECQCDLFSDPAASVHVASVMPVAFFPSIVTRIILAPAGTATDPASFRLPQPIRIPSTPPPRA
jgi:hypothetical protein